MQEYAWILDPASWIDPTTPDKNCTVDKFDTQKNRNPRSLFDDK